MQPSFQLEHTIDTSILDERFVSWLTTTQDLSPHTIRAYCDDVSAFRRFAGATAVPEPWLVQQFAEHLLERADSPASVRRRLCGLRRYCRWLLAEGVLDTDPFVSLDVRIARPRRLPRAVSTVDLVRIVRCLQERSGVGSIDYSCDRRPVPLTLLLGVLLMVTTGVRVGELVALERGDVDVESRTLLIRGKGRRERLVYFPNDELAALLVAYMGPCAASEKSAEPLLRNRSGRPLTTAAFRASLRSLGRGLELRYNLTPHMLRHTAATQLIEAGVDIRFIQRLLGHASLTTTEIYTHVSDVSLRRSIAQADVLGRLLNFR